jgi:uncharacterized protein YabE (DUF348 family)/3D (Asp-Asp-Asp) domain-containing protein
LAYWLESVPARPRVRQQTLRLQSAFLGLIDTSRARLHLALFLCIFFAGVFGFVIHPPHQLKVSADGRVLNVLTRQRNLHTLLSYIGITEAPGDVLLRSGNEVSLQRAVPVIVEVDGRTLSWRTRSETVGSVLHELGIDVSAYDSVKLDGAEVGINDLVPVSGVPLAGSDGLGPDGAEEGFRLSIHRALPMTILEDGKLVPYRTARPSVEMALSDAGIRLGPGDEVDPPLTALVTSGMRVTVKHAKAVTLVVGNTSIVVYTQKAQLKDTLAEAGLRLGSDDRVEPGVEAAVTDGMTARLVRVGGRELSEREAVTKKTVFKPDESLSGNNYRVVTGRDGVRTRQYRVVIEDGQEKEKKLIRETLDPEPVATVIYYPAGTAAPTGLPEGNINVTGVNHVYATWYNPASSGKPLSDPAYNVTKTGMSVTRGIIAVDPHVIPLGTRMYVPGYGFGIAADTGGGIKGNMIDLGYADGVSPDWHTGWVDVYLLSP